MQVFAKLCGTVDGQTRIIADPPLVMPVSHLLPDEMDRVGFEEQLTTLISRYRRTLDRSHRVLFDRYQLVDLARKVVGVGSVGTRCWIFLFTDSEGGDPLFLQGKEAGRSVLADYVGESAHLHHGQRVVAGQRLMQPVSDIFLGWVRTDRSLDGRQHDFYVRQLRDWKYSLDIDAMKPAAMVVYGEMCGWTLARAHARSGDVVAMATYLGDDDVFDEALADFASAYADQNERDYESLAQAADRGRVIAHRDI
jgi:uncharacterized protein (DUF2252 family)